MTQASALKHRQRRPRRVIAPVVFGCCPAGDRCVLCPAPPIAPEVETISALVEHYRTDRAGPEDHLSVSFFGGAPPDVQSLDAIEGLPFTVRVRPDLLSRDQAAVLVERGATAIELDVGCFDDFALRWSGRPYTTSLVSEMAAGLAELGVRTGVVLTPGLPGTDYDTCIRDATKAGELFDTARIQPVLVLGGSRLQEMFEGGRYTPLTTRVAVAVCRDMMAILDAQNVEIIRVGAQPGPDGMGKLIAGPYHSSFRELVESKRAQDALRPLIASLRSPTSIRIRCAAGDETRARGPANANIRIFRVEFELERVVVEADPRFERGQWAVEKIA